MKEKQIKSRERVRDLAEVFTNKREVDAMLDLVFNEIETDREKIYYKFLEPACGNGAFLKEILKRKLDLAVKHSKNEIQYMYLSLITLASIYAIDICHENVHESKEALILILNDYLENNVKDIILKQKYIENVEYILENNIQVGNTLDKENGVIFINYVEKTPFYIEQVKFRFVDLVKENCSPVELINEKYFLNLYKEV